MDDDEDLDQYISEDQETKAQQNSKMAQWVQMAILQDLHQVLGVDVTLPENASKELILQVQISNNIIASQLSILIKDLFQPQLICLRHYVFFPGIEAHTNWV